MFGNTRCARHIYMKLENDGIRNRIAGKEAGLQVESLGLKVECPVVENNIQIVCLVDNPDTRVPEKGIKLVAWGAG